MKLNLHKQYHFVYFNLYINFVPNILQPSFL